MAAGKINSIGVIGAGAWGTALATVAHDCGNAVSLWTRRTEHARALNHDHRNDRYLGGVDLDPAIRATSDMREAVSDADAVLLVPPTQHLRNVCEIAAPHLKPGAPVVICSKGIEQGTGALPSEMVAAVLPDAPLAVLSGPTFAIEVARRLPTAVTLACHDKGTGEALIAALGRPTFRPYYSDDLTGAQVGGAVKNVIAIACGIVTGARLGDHARAALIARGLAEVARLGIALGGFPETLMGLSGLGDLTLTCTSMTSRNMSLGAALGEGRTLQDVMAGRSSVAEGVFTAPAVCALARRKAVDMPICFAVDAVLNGKASVESTVEDLLARPFKTETAG